MKLTLTDFDTAFFRLLAVDFLKNKSRPVINETGKLTSVYTVIRYTPALNWVDVS